MPPFINGATERFVPGRFWFRICLLRVSASLREIFQNADLDKAAVCSPRKHALHSVQSRETRYNTGRDGDAHILFHYVVGISPWWSVKRLVTVANCPSAREYDEITLCVSGEETEVAATSSGKAQQGNRRHRKISSWSASRKVCQLRWRRLGIYRRIKPVPRRPYRKRAAEAAPGGARRSRQQLPPRQCARAP
jgi:hypothetical protein